MIDHWHNEFQIYIWAWSWCPANLLHHKMTKKMHFESHIFQVKRDLIDTSLVTLCYIIDKKIVPMLILRKYAILHITSHDVTGNQNKFSIGPKIKYVCLLSHAEKN